MNYIIIGYIAGIIILASVARILELAYEKRKKEPLQSIKRSRLCSGAHSWKEALLLLPSELESYKANPEAYSKKTQLFCTHCGYIPQFKAMLKKNFLDSLNLQLALKAEAEQANKDLDDLEMDFLKRLFADRTSEECALINEGYQARTLFLEYLPGLMEGKRVSRERKEFDDLVNTAEFQKESRQIG